MNLQRKGKLSWKDQKRIANLKVAGKLKSISVTVLVMTLFLVFVGVISTLVIRSNIKRRSRMSGHRHWEYLGFRDNDCEIQNQAVPAFW